MMHSHVFGGDVDQYMEAIGATRDSNVELVACGAGTCLSAISWTTSVDSYPWAIGLSVNR